MKYWVSMVSEEKLCVVVSTVTHILGSDGAYFCDLRALVNPCRSRCGGLSEAIQDRVRENYDWNVTLCSRKA